MKRITGQSQIGKIKLPAANSHKGENGRLLIVAGNEQYHGSLVYAIRAAARIVDLVYVLTTPNNRHVVEKLKEKTAGFISVRGLRPGRYDCILIGPGMGVNRRTYNLTRAVLKSGIRAVLDADALKVLDSKLKKLLNQNHILTPHSGEFKIAFRRRATTESVKEVVQKYRCNIILKGRTDVAGIYQFYRIGKYKKEGRVKIWYNRTGNAGMTKGGTGDVLAGLVAALFCKNEAVSSAITAAYANGLAGDNLYRKIGPYYSTEDLLDQIPTILWRMQKYAKAK